MKILVVGGGGREHALCRKIASSPRVKKLLCAPGNAGIAAVAECRSVAANDLDGLCALAESERIDLVVIGPEDPLCAGLVDRLEAKGIRAFGPRAAAAQIEGSKAFCKDLMRRHHVATPGYRTFEDTYQAIGYLDGIREFPIVVKASGLAAGKGVVVCNDRDGAVETVKGLLENRTLGEAGSTVVIEEFIRGPELSVLCITDGSAIVPLEPARDHKRLLDGDQGPNTGGMGAVCPVPVPHRLKLQVEQQILLPVVHAMNREGRKFQGILYAGLILGPKGPLVLEFNARFGDPEAQSVLMRFADDLVPYLEAAADGTLEKLEGPSFDKRTAVTVVAASEGYPVKPLVGRPIAGLDDVDEDESLCVFHAGTSRAGGAIVTSGGRVLAATALAPSIAAARERAYGALDKIRFAGKQVRRDIGLSSIE